MVDEIEAVVQQVPRVIPGDHTLTQGGGVITALFALVGGFMWLRRKFSQDKLATQKDAGEGNLLRLLMEERNTATERANRAWEQHAEDSRLIGRLSSEVESLAELNHKTNNEVSLMRLLNEKTKQEMDALRDEFAAVRAQIHACAKCPLRGYMKQGGDSEAS